LKRCTTDRSARGNYVSAVVRNAGLSERYFLLELSKPETFPDSLPGNFVHVRVPGRERFFLRRPFSIFDCTGDTISLLVLERGAGTSLMRTTPEGARMEFMGPLGNSFPVVPGKRILAIAGGVGLAPLYYLARSARSSESVKLVYGGRTRDDLFLDRIDLEAAGALLATEDGSYGFSGNVVQLAEKTAAAEDVDAVFSCGPLGMLAAAAELAVRLGVPHYVSLENRMACGFGVCRSCVIQIAGPDGAVNRTVCHDGPVFDAGTILWDRLPVP
jgi:dihydroorotate dehydrogenase electron transfer subunit